MSFLCSVNAGKKRLEASRHIDGLARRYLLTPVWLGVLCFLAGCHTTTFNPELRRALMAEQGQVRPEDTKTLDPSVGEKLIRLQPRRATHPLDAGKDHPSVMRFSLSDVPRNAVIRKAILRLRKKQWKSEIYNSPMRAQYPVTIYNVNKGLHVRHLKVHTTHFEGGGKRRTIASKTLK